MANVDAWSLRAKARKTLRWCQLMKSWTLVRAKGVVSDGVPVYSPGHIRKKKTMLIMSATAILQGEEARAATA